MQQQIISKYIRSMSHVPMAVAKSSTIYYLLSAKPGPHNVLNWLRGLPCNRDRTLKWPSNLVKTPYFPQNPNKKVLNLPRPL